MNEVTPVASTPVSLRSSDWATTRGEQWRAQLTGMEATLKPVDDPLIRALNIHQETPLRYADLACGGGGTTLELRKQVPAGSVVHGFDVSPALVEAARARGDAAKATVSFERADISVEKPAQAYDRLISRFGIMFFEAPESAFTNLVDWLTPGGRFAFAVWASPFENPWITTALEVVSSIVEVPLPDPGAPGPFRYADGNTLLHLLRNAGFCDLEIQDWRGTLPIGGGVPASQAAAFALESFSSFAALLSQAGESALIQAQTALSARLLPHEVQGAVHLDACVHLVTGTRPKAR